MAALQPGGGPRASLLVLMRGESFRAGPGRQGAASSGTGALTCTREGREAQSLASSSQLTLFADLAVHFDVTVALHTYPVPGCSLLEYYAPPDATWGPPRATYYDYASHNQTSLWQAAWQAELGRAPGGNVPYDAALALRLDTALRRPAALARRFVTIAQRAAPLSESSELWVAHPIRFNDLPLAKPPMDEYFCASYARQDGAAPFIADSLQAGGRPHQMPTVCPALRSPRASYASCASFALPSTFASSFAHQRPHCTLVLQWVPRRHFTLMASHFPAHDTTDCLRGQGADIRFLLREGKSPAPQDCRNDLYYFTGRNVSATECGCPSTEEFVRACWHLAEERWGAEADGVAASGRARFLRDRLAGWRDCAHSNVHG